MHRSSRIAAILSTGVCLTSCIYIPSFGGKNPSEETLYSLRPGEIGMADVIHRFGEPNALRDSRFFVYELEKGKGTLIGAAGYGGGSLSLGRNYTRLLCEFDSSGRLVRHSVMRASEDATTMKYKTAPGRDSVEVTGVPRTSPSSEKDIVLRGSNSFRAVAFSPDGETLVAGDESGRLWLRSNATGRIREIAARPGFPSRRETSPVLEFRADGRDLLFLARGIRILDTASWQDLARGTLAGAETSPLAWDAASIAGAPDGRSTLAGGYDGSIRTVEPVSGVVGRAVLAHRGAVHALCYSPDGQLVASASRDEGVVKIWDAATWVQLAAVKARAGAIRFLPAGTRLAVHRGGWVEVWRIDAARETPGSTARNVSTHIEDVFLTPCFEGIVRDRLGLAVSPDGKRIAASCGPCAIYDVGDRRQVWSFVPAQEKDWKYLVKDWAYAPDGRSLAVVSRDGVRLWSLSQGDTAAKSP